MLIESLRILLLVWMNGRKGIKISKSLYTAAEIKAYKEEQIKKQNGIDPILGIPFPKGNICQDHDHFSQHCRGALHFQSNAFEGKVINAYVRCLGWLTEVPLPVILRNLADYLEVDYTSSPYHNGFLKKLKTMFNALNAFQQNKVLEKLGVTQGSNPSKRKELFSKVILDREKGFEYIRDVIYTVKES